MSKGQINSTGRMGLLDYEYLELPLGGIELRVWRDGVWKLHDKDCGLCIFGGSGDTQAAAKNAVISAAKRELDRCLEVLEEARV